MTKQRLADCETGGDAEPEARQSKRDQSLWYPPLGLMKLATFHKRLGDEVDFAIGCDKSKLSTTDEFQPAALWDRIYITTLFTFHFDRVVDTIEFYKEAVGGTVGKIYVGGIMASLMPDAIGEKTGVYPITGILNSPARIDLPGDTDIDLLPPDYSLLDKPLYAINDTYYAYATRGCVNKCAWCGVPKLEPQFAPYMDIKPMIEAMRAEYGDKPLLKLMDNNLVASEHLELIVNDLVELGYGRGSLTDDRKHRVVDFNQGLDATYLTEARMKLLAQLNISPMRIAFDRAREEADYVRAVKLAHSYGVRKFSNYMLYNWNDTPSDLYKRLMVNIRLNEELGRRGKRGEHKTQIYSYPMRFAPIDEKQGEGANRHRDYFVDARAGKRNWLTNPIWTPRFVRNIEIMKGAAHGAISPTPSLARRTIGNSFRTFLANLYMPEELLRYRNQHEAHVYPHEPKRPPGTGKVERFRGFILRLLGKRDEDTRAFHNAVAPNRTAAVREAMDRSGRYLNRQLELYLEKR